MTGTNQILRVTTLAGFLQTCERCTKLFWDDKELRFCWSCGCPDCGERYRIGIWNFRCQGTGDHKLGPHYTGDHNIHPSERVVMWRNPQTGETRIPGRADRDIHPKYKAAGFTERVALETHQEVRKLEKEKGLVHESSHYDSNSSKAAKDTGSIG
jgi:hypothetical protein